MSVNVLKVSFVPTIFGVELDTNVAASAPVDGMTYGDWLSSQTNHIPTSGGSIITQPDYVTLGFPIFPILGNIGFNTIDEFLEYFIPQFSSAIPAALALPNSTNYSSLVSNPPLVCSAAPYANPVSASFSLFSITQGTLSGKFSSVFQLPYTRYFNQDGEAFQQTFEVTGSVISPTDVAQDLGLSWADFIPIINGALSIEASADATAIFYSTDWFIRPIITEFWNVALPPCTDGVATGYGAGFGLVGVDSSNLPSLILQEIVAPPPPSGPINGQFTFPSGSEEDAKYINWSMPPLNDSIAFQNFGYSIANMRMKP